MIDIATYIQQEHPEVHEEYNRYKRIQESKQAISKGVKVVTLTNGFGGFGGQELIVLGKADWIKDNGVELIDINGQEYGCAIKEFHKNFKIVDSFEEDWNFKDIKTEENEDDY